MNDIDPIRLFELLEDQDPRINPLPVETPSGITIDGLLKRRLHTIETFLRVLSNHDGNVFRHKALLVRDEIVRVRGLLPKDQLMKGGAA